MKAPLTAFSAMDTIVLTLIHSRCRAQVSIVLESLYMNSQITCMHYTNTNSFSLISDMRSLTQMHFIPRSRRAPRSKDSGSLCNSEQRNPVRAVPHTNIMLTCSKRGRPQIWPSRQGSAAPPQHHRVRTPNQTRGYWARARSFVRGQSRRMSRGETLSCHANEAVWIRIWIWDWHRGWERQW